MKPVHILIAFAAVVLLILLNSSTYTVGEQEQVIITQFGRPVGRAINAVNGPGEAGLHFKSPFIQDVNRFDKRIMLWDSDDPRRGGRATDMPTRDKLYIVVETFERWRISDPLKYFQSLRDERSAVSRLEDIVGSEVRNVIARHDLIEVIRTDKTRKPDVDQAIAQITPKVSELPPIQFGREKLEQEILEAATPKVKIWGIELLDVRFKRVNYKSGVLEKIHQRMQSERQQIAERFRSQGQGEAAKIMGTKERELRRIESDAYKRVQEIQGKADAQATQIYAEAYNSSPAAADFYQFMKTLETYKDTLGRGTTAVFTTDSDYFKFLKRITPEKNSKPHAP